MFIFKLDLLIYTTFIYFKIYLKFMKMLEILILNIYS